MEPTDDLLVVSSYLKIVKLSLPNKSGKVCLFSMTVQTPYILLFCVLFDATLVININLKQYKLNVLNNGHISLYNLFCKKRSSNCYQNYLWARRCEETEDWKSITWTYTKEITWTVYTYQRGFKWRLNSPMYQVIPIYMSEKCMALKGNKKYVLLNNDFVVFFFFTQEYFWILHK